MSDENERSVASAGSVEDRPSAYRVYVRGIGSIMPLCQDWTEVQGILNRFGDRVFGVAPLYEEPPLLTDVERQAIEGAISCCEDITYGGAANQEAADVLKALLERTK